MNTKNIMIVGVGGQGSLLASRILGAAAMNAGYDVKVSEVHGMSQRGGSVVTYVRYGESVASPVICEGEADVILSFEKLEAARWLPYLKIGGTIVTALQEINPMPVIIGAKEYPHAALDNLSAKGVKIDCIDALAPALEAGSAKAVNIVLMGRLSKYLDIAPEKWEAAIRESVAEKFVEMNLKAFALGRK